MNENTNLYVGVAIAIIICLIYCCILIIAFYKYNSTPTQLNNQLSYVNTTVIPTIIDNKYIYYFKQNATITFKKPTIISSIIISGGISKIPSDPTNNSIYAQSLSLYCIVPSFNVYTYYDISPITYNITVGTAGNPSSFNDFTANPPVRTMVGIPSHILMGSSGIYDKKSTLETKINNVTLLHPNSDTILSMGAPRPPPNNIGFNMSSSRSYNQIGTDNSKALNVRNRSIINSMISVKLNNTEINTIPGYDGSEFNNGCVIIIIDPLFHPDPPVLSM
jgi:hypothetical protein